MDELYIQLIALFFVAFTKNIAELGIPLLKFYLKTKTVSISGAEERKKAERWAIAWLHENLVIRDEVEYQNKLPAYQFKNVDGTFDDFLELVV